MESNDNSGENPRRLDLLLDVPLDIAVELGRARMSIQDLLALGPGSVIELDKIAGEALDILVNDRLVARGEAVVVNDKFGVRITDSDNDLRSQRHARGRPDRHHRQGGRDDRPRGGEREADRRAPVPDRARCARARGQPVLG